MFHVARGFIKRFSGARSEFWGGGVTVMEKRKFWKGGRQKYV